MSSSVHLRRELDLTRTAAAFDARGLTGAVHGTLPVVAGHVDVASDGTPVSVVARLDLTGLATGHPRRDRDLLGSRFFDAGRHPDVLFHAEDVRPAISGWCASGVLTIGGRECPVTLAVDPDADAFVGVSTVDVRDLGVRAPGFLIRRRVVLTVTGVLR